MFQTKVVEKVKTHISCPITFFSKIQVLMTKYEKVWKKCGRSIQATDDIIIYRVGFTCRLTKAADKLRIYNTYRFYNNGYANAPEC